MNADQKFRLAKIAIWMTFITLTILGITLLAVLHNPKSFSVTVDVQNQKMGIECVFESQEE